MPPEALTPVLGPTVSRMSLMCSAVAPPVEKPVEVLTKSAPLRANNVVMSENVRGRDTQVNKIVMSENVRGRK